MVSWVKKEYRSVVTYANQREIMTAYTKNPCIYRHPFLAWPLLMALTAIIPGCIFNDFSSSTSKVSAYPIWRNTLTISTHSQLAEIAQQPWPVIVQYWEEEAFGATSIRFASEKEPRKNPYPEGSTSVFGNRIMYDPEYILRDRDVGQTFYSGEQPFVLHAIHVKVCSNREPDQVGGSEIGIQLFEVEGEPVLNHHGTPGFLGYFDRMATPELDDYLTGETYKPLMVATGKLPDTISAGDLLCFTFGEKATCTLEAQKYYAFLIFFVERTAGKNLALANNYYGGYQPNPQKPLKGHGIRREGKPDFPDRWDERLNQAPGTLGFPDVCTYRDFFFAISGNTLPGSVRK
jgi:hypothetical protein